MRREQRTDTKKVKHMKLTVSIILGAVLACALQAADAPDNGLKSQTEKVSYSIGVNWGKMLKRDFSEVDLKVLLGAIKDTMDGKPKLTEDETRQVMTTWQQELRGKQEAKNKEAGEKNKKEGAAFLEANKKKDGVKVTASGLQYKIIKEGTGPKPASSDTVSVHYRGRLLDDTEFDSSFKRNAPASFPVTGVIKGWIEALQLMPVGSQWELYIPSELAYGERGTGQNIGPNSVLIFTIDLLEIKAPENKPTTLLNQPVTSDIIKVPSAEELKKGAKIEVIKDPAAEAAKAAAEKKKNPKQ